VRRYVAIDAKSNRRRYSKVLGVARLERINTEQAIFAGVVTGLAWTVGGDILLSNHCFRRKGTMTVRVILEQ
jgi:ATP-dependent Lon protease